MVTDYGALLGHSAIVSDSITNRSRVWINQAALGERDAGLFTRTFHVSAPFVVFLGRLEVLEH